MNITATTDGAAHGDRHRRFPRAPCAKLKLGKRPTEVRPYYSSDDDYERTLERHVEPLRELQSKLYAHNRYALLMIFQAMDAGR